jgi:hypothetical protein
LFRGGTFAAFLGAPLVAFPLLDQVVQFVGHIKVVRHASTIRSVFAQG